MNAIEFLILLLAAHYCLFILTVAYGIFKVKREKNHSSATPVVSVIIVFRNEEYNLPLTINSLNDLNYEKTKLEILFMNDNSTDDSVKIINEMINLPNYKILELDNDGGSRAYKKRAIEQAVAKAGGEIIFVTDADCNVSAEWISSTLKCFSDNVAFVTGPVTFREEKTFFQKIQKLEFAGLNLVGAGLIGIEKPKIASAANMAFRKDVFVEINGYEGVEHLSSGDDELLMQKIHAGTNHKIEFCFSKNALVETKGNSSLAEFANQRRRWASKGLFYKDKLFVIRLILIALFYLSLPISLAAGLLGVSAYVIVFTVSILFKIIPEFLVLRNGAGLLFDKQLLLIFPLAQIFQIPYIIISSLLGTIGNYSWKGRKLKR